MKVLGFVFCWCFMVHCVAQSAVADFSDSDRKLTVATLYLSQCAVRSDNFRDIASSFGDKNIMQVDITDSGRARYFDAWAGAMIHLGDDACIVEILTEDFDKFLSSLPQLLQIKGGKLNLEKGENEYTGVLVQDGKTFKVQVYFDPSELGSIATAALMRY